MIPPGNRAIRRWLWKPAVPRASAGVAFCLVLAACGGGGSGSGGSGGGGASTNPPPATETLSQADVQMVVQAAATAAQSDGMAIAVVDRMGRILAVYVGPSAPTTSPGNFGAAIPTPDLAVALARTGAFFSNDQAPLSSRTVRFISGVHFPPGVLNSPPADLYGIENTNRGCTLVDTVAFQSQIPPSLALGGGFGPGVLTGKADAMDSNPLAVNPGGVPIFYQNVVVGGIGVVTSSSNLSLAEYTAFAGSTVQRTGPSDSFGPTPAAPGVVFIGGIALPFVAQTALPSSVSAGPVAGAGSYFVAPANS